MEQKGEYFVVLKAFEELGEGHMKGLVEEWFASGEPNENLVQIRRCFSAYQINKYKANNSINK